MGKILCIIMEGDKSVWEKAIIVDGQDEELFNKTMADLKDHKEVFVFLTGEKTAEGVSWCPDCNQVSPTLQQTLNARPQAQLVLVSCRRADYKGVPSYPMRRHKGVRLTTLPTFGRWINGRLEMRLEDMQIKDTELLEEVMNQ